MASYATDPPDLRVGCTLAHPVGAPAGPRRIDRGASERVHPLDDQRPTTSSRRALLGAAAAAAIAVAADAIIRPEPVAATTGAMQFGTGNNAGSAATRLTSSVTGIPALTVDNASAGATALFGNVSGVGAIGVYGLADNGFGILGDTALATKGNGAVGAWGRDRDTPGKIGTAGTSYEGAGVVGYAAPGAGDAVPPTPGGLVGVYGYAPAGTGVFARSDSGTALRVAGKVSLSRSGRVNLPKGKAYVDVNLSSNGGLAGSPLCIASIMTRRGGVHVETVRPNYPSAGKLRIYLNKVASSTSSTTIAWIVIG